MDEDDVISEPEDGLEEYTADAEERDSRPPKNPSGTESFIIVLLLGVLPDVIDFFSIGGLSFLSSALSWPVTELYFSKKNLKAPNIRKWIRAFNLGDVIPFLGVIPLKTTGLIIAIYIAWHPESKAAKGLQAIDAAASAKISPKEFSGGRVQQKSSLREKVAGAVAEKEKVGTMQSEQPIGADKDIYEEIREGGGGIKGPEEEAEIQTFGEIPNSAATEEEPIAAPVPREKEPSTTLPKKSEQRPVALGDIAQDAASEKTEEIEERLGIGEVEREIKEKLSSPEAVMEDTGIPTQDGERMVDLSGKGK